MRKIYKVILGFLISLFCFVYFLFYLFYLFIFYNFIIGGVGIYILDVLFEL